LNQIENLFSILLWPGQSIWPETLWQPVTFSFDFLRAGPTAFFTRLAHSAKLPIIFIQTPPPIEILFWLILKISLFKA
jgi:hypothetical protein